MCFASREQKFPSLSPCSLPLSRFAVFLPSGGFAMSLLLFFFFKHLWLLDLSRPDPYQHTMEYIYVICRPGGPYWEKLCHRSCVRPEAACRGPYPRPRAQFFPIQTDLGRKNNVFIIFFRRVLCKQFLC